MLEINKIYCEDCLTGMQKIDTESIDMILCDLPYGKTHSKWDVIIPCDLLWEQYERIIKPHGAIVLTATEPFSSLLISSNLKLFRYDLIWQKNHPKGHLNAKRMPLRGHEQILIFYKKPPHYHPEMRTGKYRQKGGNNAMDGTGVYGKAGDYTVFNDQYYPTSIVNISNAIQTGKIHPNEKPVELFEYLIRMYSDKNSIVMDNCMGSGTTAIACLNTDRIFIGFENDYKYYCLANKRIFNYVYSHRMDNERTTEWKPK